VGTRFPAALSPICRRKRMLGLNIKRFHFTCGADILVCGFWRLSSRQFILENTGKFRESRRGGPRRDSKAALHSKRKRFK